MIWREEFSEKRIRWGLALKKWDLVKNLSVTQDGDLSIYSADVISEGKPNSASVLFDDGVLHRFTCDCRDGQSGIACEHVAAICFSAEELNSKSEKLNPAPAKNRKKIVYPFQNDKQNDYQYFDLSKIFSNFVINENTLKQAQKLIDEYYYIRRVSLEYDYFSNLPVIHSAFWEAELTFDKNEVIDSSCFCYNCRFPRSGLINKNGSVEPCSHLLAAMLLAKAYVDTNDIDNTDRKGVELIKFFKNRKITGNAQTIDCSVGNVQLVPRLTLSGGEYKLSFKVGTEKLYVVKSLSNLIREAESGGRYTLSPNNEIDFKYEHFDKAGEKYYKFIRVMQKELQHLNETEGSRSGYTQYREISDLKANADMYGRRVDDFYELFCELGDCEFINKDENKKAVKLVKGEEIPEISINVSKEIDESGVFQGIYVTGDFPLLLLGANSAYAFTSRKNSATIIKLDDETSEKLLPLMNLGIDSDFSMHIGRKNIGDFYRSVMPVFRKIADITESDTEEIREYLPPTAEFKFYIDSTDGRPSCRVKVHYDDKVHSPLEWLTSGFNSQYYRDEITEKDVVRLVREFFPIVNIADDTFTCEEGDETAVYYLMKNGVQSLEAIGEVFSTDSFKSLRIRPPVNLSVNISVQSDLLNLEVTTTDLSAQELLDILSSYRTKKKFHRLKSGDFVDIDESFQELDDILSGMHISDKEFLRGNIQIPAYRSLYLDKMLEEKDDLYTHRDRNFRKLIKEFKTVNDSDFDVPDSLKSVVRPYQEVGFKWLSTLSAYGFGGILADDMGLGKTLQMISLILSEFNANEKPGTSLVVCPASLVYNWGEEFKKFAPELTVALLAGGKSERNEILSHYEDYDVLVTSYNLLVKDILDYEDKRFNFQVIDEAQYIKNRSIGITKSVKLVKSKKKFALTGTPIENRLSELWSIFDFLMPGFLYKYEEFKKRFESPIMKKSDEQASKELRKMISPFILRRIKKDVLKELPDKIEETRYAQFSDEQQKLYDAQVTKLLSFIEGSDDESIKKEKIQILAEITRTREICCDPSLVFENYTGESAKRQACLDLVKSAIEGEHRILLFSQFTSMIQLIEKDLKEEGIEYYKISGETPKKRRLELVDSFNRGDTPVFLISLKAGGTGLNLTGADVVIHYDPWWNVAVQNQATDRAHRIGQNKVVTVYKLIASGSIEEKIEKLQRAKQNLSEEILSGASDSIGSMSREELLDLISG